MSSQSNPESRPTAGTDIHTFRFRLPSNHQIFRRIIQIGVLGFITFISARHVVIGEESAVITASPEAYCPFGGLETLYKYITSGRNFVSHVHLSNVVLLIAVLTVALLFRSAFCGWICPLGFIQDIFNRFSKFLQRYIPEMKRVVSSLQKRRAQLAILDRYLRMIKYLVLVWAIGGSAYFGFMVFRDYDPWAALINIAEFSFTPGIIVLAITLITSFFVKRPWCRYVCPLGAVSGLVGKISPTYLKRNESICISCKKCSKACPMGLTVHSASTVKSVDCITCLECVDSCPVKGTLEIKVGIPLVGK